MTTNIHEQTTYTDQVGDRCVLYLHQIDRTKRGIYQRVRVTKSESVRELKRMPPQRDARAHRAEGHRLSIERNSFVYLPGQAIHFDIRGHLRNGMHRLAGLALSDKPLDYSIKVDVVTQCTDKELQALDLCAPRQVRDILSFRQGVSSKDNASVACIARSAMLYDSTGSIDAALSSRASMLVTRQDEIAYIEHHYDELKRAAQFITSDRTRGAKLLTPRVEGWLYLLFSRIDREEAARFFTYLATGADLPSASPLLMLRNRLALSASTKRKAQVISTKEAAVYVIKTWNALRIGQEIKVFRYARGEKILVVGLPTPTGPGRDIAVHCSSSTPKKLKEIVSADYLPHDDAGVES